MDIEVFDLFCQIGKDIEGLRIGVRDLTGAVQELSLIAEEIREVRRALERLAPSLAHFHHLSELRDSVDRVASILRS